MSSTKEKLRSALLLITVAWCGATVMILEIIGTRVIAPLYGMSLFVWTALISVTLVSLAIGYYFGGWLADRSAGSGNERTIYLALCACALWLLLLPFFKRPFMLLGVGLGMRGGALLAATLLFAPPLACLGTVGPLAIRTLSDRLEVVGRKVGYVYAISTSGSFLGTLAVGFYLLPVLGLRAIFLLLAVISLLLPALFFVLTRNVRGVVLIVITSVLAGGLCFATLPGSSEQIIYSGQSIYGQIAIMDREHKRFLLLDGIVQSGVVLPEMLSCFDYISAMERLAFAYHRDPKAVLVIGVGGGLMAGSLRRRGIKVDMVDIDPRMQEMARRYFDLPDAPGAFYAMDGRAFLAETEETYDVIVLDVYSGESCPAHLTSLEAFGMARDRLKKNGLLVMNFLGRVAGEEAVVTKAVGRTLRQVFPNVFMHYRGRASDFNNVFFVAVDGEGTIDFSREVPLWEPLRKKVESVLYRRIAVDSSSGMILTDDYNPVDYLDWRMREQWRQQTVKFLGHEELASIW